MWQHCRLCILVAVASVLSGCATAPDTNSTSLVLGEHVAYRVVNLAARTTLEMPTLVDTDGGQVLYSTLRLSSKRPQKPRTGQTQREYEPSRAMMPVHIADADVVRTALMLPDVLGQDPGDTNLTLPPVNVSVAAIMPNGHRVPKHVQLSWRQPPRPGQPVFGGHRQKPIQIPLRSRIPAWVLAQVNDQWRYRLDLDVIVGAKNAVDLRWRVLCFSDGSLHEIGRGGQW